MIQPLLMKRLKIWWFAALVAGILAGPVRGAESDSAPAAPSDEEQVSGNEGEGVGNTGLGNQGTGRDPDGSGNTGGGSEADGDGLPNSENAQGGNVGTGNEGEGVGNSGPGDQGQGEFEDVAGNTGGERNGGGDNDDGSSGGGGGGDGDDDDGGSYDGSAYRWDGGDNAKDLWTKKNNWDPNYVPANDGTADLIFDGTVRLRPDMNEDWNVNSITFDAGAGAFTLGSSSGRRLTVQGGGFVNNSPNLQTIDLSLTLGASQSWVANSGSMTFNGSVETAGNTLTLAGSQNITVNGAISGSGGLTKNGTGTAVLTGANTFTGNVVINQGTLLLGGSGVIADSVDMTLSGGVLATGGYSETLDTLTLTANSTIDFSSSSGVLNFSNSSGQFWAGGSSLRIQNWNGSTTGYGAEQLYFGSSSSGLTSDQLAQIEFVNPAGYIGVFPATILPSGEVVPMIIPEPTTVLALGFVAGIAGYRERKRISAGLKRAFERLRGPPA